jgi:hypothetical protein
MPINPQIVVPQIQGIQLENPLNMAKNALAIREAQSQIAANQLKTARAQQLKTIFAGQPGQQRDPQALANALIQGGFPEEAKQIMDFTTSTSQSRKAALESEAAQFALLGSEAGAFANDPASLNKASILPWASAAVQRGLLTPEAFKRFEALPDDPRELGAAMRRLQVQALTPVQQLETSVMEQGLGGESRVLRIPKLGGAAEEVAGSRAPVTASPNRPVTQILMPAETERQKALGKGGAEADIAEYNTVRSAARSINKDYETIKLLQEGKPSTGITAELELGFNRLKAAAGGKPDAIEKVADTEYLEALLGSDVFNQFQALGVGARGLDTPAEREFLRQVISGTRTLDKETLIRMAEMRAKYKRSLVEEFNERVESGELDDFFRDYGRTKRPFTLPKPPEVTVTGPGGKPLGQSAQQPVQVKSVEEARALKPGTRFITPDGREKVR